MLNKEQILEKARVNAQSKQIAIRVIDLAGQVLRKHEPAFSDFMTPEDQDAAEKILWQIPDVNFAFYGGYGEAEYLILGIFPDWMQYANADFPIRVVNVNAKEDVTHQSVLGSVLGLGIKREKIGDLIVYDEVVQIISKHEIADYIAIQLRKIGRQTVETELTSVGSLRPKEPEYEDISATVKSLRLDSVVASGFRISRGKAAELIKQERVKVNYRFITSVSAQLKEGDLISVRGKGRLIYAGEEGATKKERIRIHLRKII